MVTASVETAALPDHSDMRRPAHRGKRGCHLLEAESSDLNVVAVTTDSDEALRNARELLPDVALLDVYLRDTDVAESVRGILSASSKTKVLIFNLGCEDQHLRNALAAGAAGYVTKDSELSVIAEECAR
jgi:DNA-binding NarL/FixJ family response regulator